MDTIVLTHGAGSNRNAPLLIALDAAFTESGMRVFRVDLWFREQRRSGPPYGADAVKDRATLRAHAAEARRNGTGRVFLGGHSYGGRQASMLVAEEPDVADGLLLLSYPLHPPRRPDEPRTKHFPSLRTAALFVHGTRDQFGTSEELRAAISLIPARTVLMDCEGAGHDLRSKQKEPLDDVAARIAKEFLGFVVS
jgi:predicted alpha/beta-hydrolase family hydrolase